MYDYQYQAPCCWFEFTCVICWSRSGMFAWLMALVPRLTKTASWELLDSCCNAKPRQPLLFDSFPEQCVLCWAKVQVGWLANEQQLNEQELRGWVHHGGYGRLVSPWLSLTRNHRWIANVDRFASHNTAMPLSATASLKSYSALRCCWWYHGFLSMSCLTVVASCKSFRRCVTFQTGVCWLNQFNVWSPEGGCYSWTLKAGSIALVILDVRCESSYTVSTMGCLTPEVFPSSHRYCHQFCKMAPCLVVVEPIAGAPAKISPKPQPARHGAIKS